MSRNSALQELLLAASQSGELSGRLKINEQLAQYTTWRTGGQAECWYQPKNVADLQNILQLISNDVAIFWMGLGSNILIRDGGLDGLVINTNGALNALDVNCDNGQCLLEVQAGLPCAIFSRKAANAGLHGAEFLSGIPGTMGGALAMNAGAFGGETWRHVVSVTMINKNGELIRRTPDEFNIAYRQVSLKSIKAELALDEWFLAALFKLTKDTKRLDQSKAEIKRLLTVRAQTQPTKHANAGSVFKNPDNDYAARLIESCGLKGQYYNDAQISIKHANFIINKGHARAQDIEQLINKVRSEVMLSHGIELQTEVKIIGKHAAIDKIVR